MAYRVIQWATGGVGRAAIEGVLDHPELTLVGCWVHSESKEGRDVGELIGRAPIGVEATRDVDALLALGADHEAVRRLDEHIATFGGTYPVIMSYGPYAKWLHWQDGYPYQWKQMVEDYPDTLVGSSNRYQNWELVDPEIWVPEGYSCVRVDSRGMGRSPGKLDPWSPREAYSGTVESSVYVRRDSQGLGIGRLLYERMLEDAKRIGHRTVIAQITEGNAVSKRLHDTLGFRDVGILRQVGKKFDQLLDVRIMQLIIE